MFMFKRPLAAVSRGLFWSLFLYIKFSFSCSGNWDGSEGHIKFPCSNDLLPRSPEVSFGASCPVTELDGLSLILSNSKDESDFLGSKMSRLRKSGGPHSGLCLECGIENQRLFFCKVCRNVWFCSKVCEQKACQKGHAQLCVPVTIKEGDLVC